MSQDLSRLALALEYVDLAAGHFLAGGSEHAARLLATAAETLLGDLARLVNDDDHGAEVQTLLASIARAHVPAALPAPHSEMRQQQQSLARAGRMGDLPEDVARQATAALLRACWYQLESMGLEAVAPDRLRRAIEVSTIWAEVTL
jgi:hypothetical protein